MKKLTDYLKLGAVIAFVPTVLTAQTYNITESARNIYAHVQKHGTPIIHQLNQRYIPARSYDLTQDEGKTRIKFTVFEVNGFPYLVMTRRSDHKVEEFTDRAPNAGSGIDGFIDSATMQEGTGPKQPIDLNKIDIGDMPIGATWEASFARSVFLADKSIKQYKPH